MDALCYTSIVVAETVRLQNLNYLLFDLYRQKKSANLQGVGITLEFFDLEFLFDDNKLNNFYHISNVSNHVLGQFRILPSSN